ncbi:MAG TPA: AAA family ATPase [Polyangia bacterium]
MSSASPAIFVGRRVELERFTVASRRLRLVLVYGVAGVGKTAFVLRAGHALAARLRGRLVHHRCRPGETLGTVARAALVQLAAGAGRPGPSHPADPVLGLAAAAQATPVVLLLDDAHLARRRSLFEDVAQLVRERPRLFVCLASRELLPISPAEVDHLVIRLSGLTIEDTHALWTALERLYGPPAVPLGALARRRAGNPLLLKQAFASPPGPKAADPLGVRRLPALEADLLGELCAYRRPVPPAALLPGRDPRAVMAALERLGRRFLVERAPGDRVVVHDLVRDAVAQAGRGPTAAQHGRCFAYYRELQRASPADETVEMELLHHAVGGGDDEAALAILDAHAQELRRLVPASAVMERELGSAIDELGRRRALPVAVRLLRARVRGRQGEVARAYEEAAALVPSGEPLVALDLGEMAYVLGHLQEAAQHLSAAAASPALGAAGRTWAGFILAEVHRRRGALRAAERTVARLRPRLAALGPLGQTLDAWVAGMLAYDQEDYPRASIALRQAAAQLQRAAGEGVSIPLVGSFLHVAMVAGGEGPVASPPTGEVFDDTLFFRLAARMYHAEALLYEGAARAAAALAGTTSDAAGSLGYLGQELWAGYIWGEAAGLLGHPAAVVARLEPLLRRGEARRAVRECPRLRLATARALLAQGELGPAAALARAGLRGLARAPGTAAGLRAILAGVAVAAGRPAAALTARGPAPRAQGYHAAAWRLARAEARLCAGAVATAQAEARATLATATRAGWGARACAASLLLAEAALRAGDYAAAEEPLAAAAEAAAAGGYAAMGLRTGLLEAALARTRGAAEPAREALTQVIKRGTELGLPVETDAARVGLAALADTATAPTTPAVRLAARLGLAEPLTRRLRRGPEVRWLTDSQAAAIDDRGYELFVDLGDGRVRLGRRRTSLAGQALLLRVLGVLAARPGVWRSQAELLAIAWGEEFHPLRHRGRVPVTIDRLRRLLGADAIEGGHDGYRLRSRGPWAIVEVLEPPRADG